MKKFSTLLLSGMLVLSFCACGGTTSDDTSVDDESTETTTEKEVTQVNVGQSIETDYFKMTVDSMEILDDYEFSMNEYSSRSLYVEEGYKLLLVRGTMENLGTEVISDNAFSATCLVNDSYEEEASLQFERSKYYELDPYTEQNYDLYINIPEKLAEQYETASFTIGFNSDMSPIVTTTSSDGTTTVDADNWFCIQEQKKAELFLMI